jgi:hypothetical protein
MLTRFAGPALLAGALLVAGAPAQVCGDCNGDGAADVVDALLGAQHAAALVILVGVDLEGCDVDSSSAVTVLDALAIAQHAAGLPVTLTCTFTPPPPPPITITLSSVAVYYNLMPPVPPDPLIVFFDATYDNPAGVAQTATILSCQLEVVPSVPDPSFTQDLTLDLTTSGPVPAGSAVTIQHRKVGGVPAPATGPAYCSATATLTIQYDLGGQPHTHVEAGIPVGCVY